MIPNRRSVNNFDVIVEMTFLDEFFSAVRKGAAVRTLAGVGQLVLRQRRSGEAGQLTYLTHELKIQE